METNKRNHSATPVKKKELCGNTVTCAVTRLLC